MLSKKMLSQEKEKEKENGKEKAVILPYTIQYQCNFIDIKGNIVRDRSYCETNKFNALLSSQEKEVAKEVEKGRRISALGTWDYSNPNILSIQLSNGMGREGSQLKVVYPAIEDNTPLVVFYPVKLS